ncbi:winged helix-turn-helix domain-containing protein [Candidatus Daviesbacteria bacterium]|nr:winged helix-turn-helix domain-containing protein [Candidatus Daviesbacteria bacterium]
MGNVVSKDEIFTEVWGEESENATDWALDALIYRLRKHPFLKAHGYIIESYKKVGYSLIQV